MALTAEQQAQVEIQVATEAARFSHQIELEARRARLEVVRLAKDILIENSRSKPVDSRNVSADDIKAYAESLVSYING